MNTKIIATEYNRVLISVEEYELVPMNAEY